MIMKNSSAIKNLASGLILSLFTVIASAHESEDHDTSPVYIGMQTSQGYIELELNREKAPITVTNFVNYTKAGFYDNTIFHRVVGDFVIQGGGYTPDMVMKAVRPEIKNEAKNGLNNDRGTIAMARKMEVDSANSQFYINLVDNKRLNHGVRDYGYAVFGKVIKGMDVVDAIGALQTNSRSEPLTQVVVESMTILEAPGEETAD